MERYLDPHTRVPLVAVVEAELVSAHADVLLGKGLETLLQRWEHAELALMFALLGRVELHPRLCARFGEALRGRGKELVMDPARDDAMVEELLELKLQADRVVDGPFGGVATFRDEVRRAFEQFINLRHNK